MAPLVAVKVTRRTDECPFLNANVAFSLEPGQVLWLRGASGAGKSLTCYALAGLSTLPGATVEAEWDQSVPEAQRLGFLFQKGVLLDALNLAENIALSLRASGHSHPTEAIDAALAAVGLSGPADGAKMPGEVRAAHARAPCACLSAPRRGCPPPAHVHAIDTRAAVRATAASSACRHAVRLTVGCCCMRAVARSRAVAMCSSRAACCAARRLRRSWRSVSGW